MRASGYFGTMKGKLFSVVVLREVYQVDFNVAEADRSNVGTGGKALQCSLEKKIREIQSRT